MYAIDNQPCFTWAGAMKPKRDADKTMRTVLKLVALAFALASAVVATF